MLLTSLMDDLGVDAALRWSGLMTGVADDEGASRR